jgi:thiamine biosynthesis lipoprotein
MRKLLFCLAVILVIASCNQNKPRNYTKIDGFAQGTTYSITYFDSLNRNFAIPVEEILEKIDSSMSVYRENSIINAFNQCEKSCEIDSLLAEVVKLSQEFNTQTYGAFDITVGPLVKTWGFHSKLGEVPNDETIYKLLQYVGPTMIRLNGTSLEKTFPEVTIDVNAIAQGFTVDVLAHFFEREGIKNYLVELGGEVRSLGRNPRGEKWLVGVDKPEDNALSGENVQVIITLSGESLVTSGNYRKFFIKEGVKYSHTIDPSTGYPVTHTLLSATVIAKTASQADALATAFMVMGVEGTKLWVKQNTDIDAYLIYSNKLGEYEVWMTEGMKLRISKQ